MSHHNFQIPDYLQKGDTVAIVATARKHIEDQLESAIAFLHEIGLKVILGKSIGLENNQLAGSDLERAQDFQNQINNPEVKAIWCVRGGYGTVRMIDLIDFSSFQKNPKWIIGFSDVTVLHQHINRMNIASLHAIMAVNVPKATEEAKQNFKKTLFGEPLHYEIKKHHLNQIGETTAEIVGGNLSIIYSLLGSDSIVDFKDKILFLEDLDEYLYHIDRMMFGLQRAGVLEHLKGLIVGNMNKMHDNPIPWGKNAEEIIYERAAKYGFPILFDFPAGHIHNNCAIPLGKKVSLKVENEKASLTFL
jgi:muramoyltetrapeptide carboxypeptidase